MSKWSRSSQATRRNAPILFSGLLDETSSEDMEAARLTTNSAGFGSTNSNSGSLFGGNKPASNPFGSSTANTGGGGLFGSSTANTGGFGTGAAGGGGFGSSTTTNSAFGSNNNTGGSGFSFGGAPKPAFGSTTSSTPLFGQGGAGTTGGFGSSSSPFGGAGSGTALSNQPVPPSEGTASTPYAPTLEKDTTGSSNYQSINFMPPYQKYSFEELRVADYNAGRQFGNTTGQAGGFGSNSFGGFGSNNTGGFGNNAASNPFGSTTTTSSGFGANTATTGFGGGSGGLFGNKTSSGGLFGPQSSAAPAGGLFAPSNSTANNAFGSGGGTGFGSTSGGLFGNNNTNNTQTQPKPSLFTNPAPNPGGAFSFGNPNAANATNNNAGGGLFGNTTNTANSGAFGGNQQQSGGLFGNNNQQQPKSLFGNSTSGFGTSTNQPQAAGGLFGGNTSTSTGTGLFGSTNNATANTSGGLFGNNNPVNTSGGLFGNAAATQPKPGGLFGGSTFGNNTTSNTGGGLFGSNNNNQQAGGLFGNNTTSNTASGFSFGNNASKPAAGSMFGNSSNQPAGGFGNSLFAPTQSSQQSQQQSDFRVSSLNDPNPYGQTSIWTGLPVPTPDNSKPLFTPLSATQKLKESQSKPPPSLRLNQSRYMTPPRRSGFGFSYSTYGTPNSAASTPGGGGLTGSMYGTRSFNGGSFGRSFGKSASVSNLRSHFNAEGNGVLSPHAFSATNTRWSSGNMRRLTIDRSIRTDLFSRPPLPAIPPATIEKSSNGNTAPPPASSESSSGPEPAYKLKKRVSFDNNTAGGQNGVSTGESRSLTRVEDEEDTTITTGSPTPEADSVRGNELAVVPEDRESEDVTSRNTAVQAKPDPQPGDYWMNPTRAELRQLPRDKLSRFVNFEVGRRGCGRVVFLGVVDLASIPLDDLYEKIVEIRLRSVTVYPDASSKPPVGKGLNVPSRISIENSWPRARGQPSSATSGPVFDKHVHRLKKMNGTEFVNYERNSGVWTFQVPHYTRYGLDYDDEDDDMGQSQLSLPPDSLASSRSGEGSGMDVDSDGQDDFEDEGDDTFAFKQKTVPGGFGKRSTIDYDDDISTAQQIEEGSAASEMEHDEDDDEDANEVSMAGSYPAPDTSPVRPILKASTMGTPGKALINIDGDWAEQLQRTISPRKQNRDALREVQSKVLLDRTYEPMKPNSKLSSIVDKKNFRTSIDIMNSLFDRHEERMADLKGRKGKTQAAPDFEV